MKIVILNAPLEQVLQVFFAYLCSIFFRRKNLKDDVQISYQHDFVTM